MEGKPHQQQKMQNLVRVANTDLDGSKNLFVGMTKIKGVGFMMSNAICKVLKLKRDTKASELDEATIRRIEEVIQNPAKFNIPIWLFNRRKDPETGENIHVSLTNVIISRDEDIKNMKKMRTYKGVRHNWGLPVRGQRTKSNFRKNKGKATGVQKKKAESSAAPATAAKPAKSEKKE